MLSGGNLVKSGFKYKNVQYINIINIENSFDVNKLLN
jgi:hypothetical protein